MKRRAGSLCFYAGIILLLAGIVCGCMDWMRGASEGDGRDHPLVVCVLDASNSMLASSGSSDRLRVGKELLQELCLALDGCEFALVSFCGEAMVDFPPSRDVDGFLSSLESIEPMLSLSAGSAIESGVVLAEGLCAGRRAVVVLVTDGEEQTGGQRGSGWVERGVPLAWCVVGGGAAMPIPLGGSWLRDPASGEVAMSKADETGLRTWVGLSSAPSVRLTSGDGAGERLALVRGLLGEEIQRMDNRESAQSSGVLGGLARIFGGLGGAFLLLYLWWTKTWRVSAVVLVLCCVAWGGERETWLSQLEACQRELNKGGLSVLERGNLLWRCGGLHWQLAQFGDTSERLEHVRRGIASCREALRCGGGEPAGVNLGVLLRLESQLLDAMAAMDDQVAQGGALPEGGQPEGGEQAHKEEGRSNDNDNQRNGEDVDDVLGMAGDAGPAPTRVEDAPKPVPEDLGSSRRSSGQADSWRSIIMKDRSVRERKTGVKPW